MLHYAIGDIHGSHAKLLALLRREKLIDDQGHWAAQDAHLVFLGDYLDRGDDGIGVLNTIMRLEVEATNAGGKAISGHNRNSSRNRGDTASCAGTPHH